MVEFLPHKLGIEDEIYNKQATQAESYLAGPKDSCDI